MTKQKHRHLLLWGLGVAGGGYLAYRFVYQPWAAAQTAAGGSTNPLSALLPLSSNTLSPAPVGILTSPSTTTTPATTTTAPGILSSISAPTDINTGVNLSTGPVIAGDVGVCMQKKGGQWTQAQCSQRLDALVAAANSAVSYINNFQAGVAQAQAALQAEQAALSGAQAAYDKATAATPPDAAGAQAWLQAIQGHQADISDLSARISAAPAQLAAYRAALAANDNDYFNLTGHHLAASV